MSITDILVIINLLLLVVVIIKLFIGNKSTEEADRIVASVKDGLSASQRELREETANSIQASNRAMIETITEILSMMSKSNADNFSAMGQSISENQIQSAKRVNDQLITLENRFKTLESSNNERLEAIKRTVGEHLNNLSESNQKKLDSIQSMVSDKLESNLRE